ncbi:HAD-IIIA family hydrolase [Nonomuraea sp. MCN248]|uniref:D,D-heptose 1,7-bisphosphate phosphatase n=1 Tax=Nonomuraea corallina TaxID=2989783 RepID=A0ABT4SGW9_9ACTN|nr:HAD-IIIA family hydrolase [Nonomuraea corallina]MDA0636370.1 HAD-IIIA family hydrolase [Nonomuraea corallina]
MVFEQRRPGAVLFDRDGTLIRDVPYNGDPARVQPMPGALEALSRLRRADLPVAVVTNQSGVAKGLITADEMEQVNARVEELLGPFDAWAICVHDDVDGCTCRKPAPGLLIRAAAVLDVSPRECVMVGDIGRDMEAARAAGARGILVPTEQTLRVEIEQAPELADDLLDVAERLLREVDAAPAPVAVGGSAWSRALGWSRW